MKGSFKRRNQSDNTKRDFVYATAVAAWSLAFATLATNLALQGHPLTGLLDANPVYPAEQWLCYFNISLLFAGALFAPIIFSVGPLLQVILDVLNFDRETRIYLKGLTACIAVFYLWAAAFVALFASDILTFFGSQIGVFACATGLGAFMLWVLGSIAILALTAVAAIACVIAIFFCIVIRGLYKLISMAMASCC